MTDDKNRKSGNRISKFCIQDKCNNKAIYNYWGMQPKYCVDHKKEYHENIYENPVTGICDYDNCDKPAKYNIRGLKPRYCFEHKNIFHVITPKKYILKEKPVVNKCDECKITASYNFPKLRPLKCLKHRKKGMVNIKRNHILCKIHDISHGKETECKKCKLDIDNYDTSSKYMKNKIYKQYKNELI